MRWTVIYHDDFRAEAETFPEAVQEELTAAANLLRAFGPVLKRPHADTLKGSKYANMKEFRFNADGGVWRTAYAPDPVRRVILLVAGDKSGRTEKMFYRRLIVTADKRYNAHLAGLKKRGGR